MEIKFIALNNDRPDTSIFDFMVGIAEDYQKRGHHCSLFFGRDPDMTSETIINKDYNTYYNSVEVNWKKLDQEIQINILLNLIFATITMIHIFNVLNE